MASEQAKLEQALNEGRVTIVGERGKRSASPEFLARLDDLPPSFRRLALARACALPWNDRPYEMPACFQWELTRAMAEASEDRAAYPHMDARLEDLFAEARNPISPLVLSQIVEMTPTGRYFSLIFAFSNLWGERERVPAWLHRELAYAKSVVQDEYRAWREVGWVE